MSTYQNQNQFAQTSVLGKVDETVNPNIKSVRINPASVSTVLQVGQAFKLIAGAANEILVDVAAITEKSYGVLIYNLKKNVYAAGDVIGIGCRDTVISLEASAAISRGARVQLDSTGPTISTLTAGTNASIGVALDQASGAGQLIRVEIDPQDINLSAY